MSDPQPLEYAQIQQRRPINVLLHITMAVAATLLIAAPMVVALLVIPRFEMVFKDFKTELPFLTKLVLGTSRWMFRGYGWTLIVPLVALFVFPGVMLDLRSPTGMDTRIYYRVAMRLLILALLVAGAVVAIACFMPMISLMDSVSGNARK